MGGREGGSIGVKSEIKCWEGGRKGEREEGKVEERGMIGMIEGEREGWNEGI